MLANWFCPEIGLSGVRVLVTVVPATRERAVACGEEGRLDPVGGDQDARQVGEVAAGRSRQGQGR